MQIRQRKSVRRARSELDFILSRTPKILADCPEHILLPLRIATGLMVLWGVSSIRRFITIEGDFTYRYPAEAIAHLLSSHEAYLSRLASIEGAGIKKV